tara:strand:- start:2187 stop:2492 length:306 start_codon:yes stop_codon:yes gene_type:complete
MPMPKGYKKKTGYGSKKSLGGMSYHEIAETMNENNYKMNHSTARNVFVNGLIKIAHNLTLSHGKKMNHKELKEIAIDPRFQEAVSEYMKEIEYEKTQGINK